MKFKKVDQREIIFEFDTAAKDKFCKDHRFVLNMGEHKDCARFTRSEMAQLVQEANRVIEIGEGWFQNRSRVDSIQTNADEISSLCQDFLDGDKTASDLISEIDDLLSSIRVDNEEIDAD